MADHEEGVPTPNLPPAKPQPQLLPQPQPQDQQQQEVVHLNWSNFKPEFSGKPEEDAEEHLLHSNDWMNAHHFVKGVKVQRFCSYTIRRKQDYGTNHWNL